MSIRYVNCYLVGKAYGGPEEGGWWYDYGTPLASTPIMDANRKESDFMCAPTDEMKIERDRLMAIFEDEAWGDPSNSTGGEEVVVTFEDQVAESFPKSKPHYE